MTTRSTAPGRFLRSDPGNPLFPTLPDGVQVGHDLGLHGASGGLVDRAREPDSDLPIFSAAPLEGSRFAAWYTGGTWITPRTLNFGVIPSPVQLELVLHNTRRTSIEVTALDLPTGVVLISPSLSFTIDAFSSVTVTLEAILAGPNEFDEIGTFTTSTGDEPVRLIGRRVFVIDVSPQAPINESLSFNTDILRSTDGTEKSYRMLQSPNSTIDYTVKFTNDLQRIRFRNEFMAGASELLVSAQKWHESRPLDVAALSTDITIFVDTTFGSFQVGKPISISLNDGSFISGTILSFTASDITLTNELGIDAHVKAKVMPAGLGYVSRWPKWKTYAVNLEEARYSVTFNQEEDIGATLPSIFPTKNGTPILEFCNELETGRNKAGNFQRAETRIDSGLSNRTAFNVYPFGDDVQVFQISPNTREAVWQWRRFFHFMNGSWGEIYVPTFLTDLPLDVPITASNTFDIPNISLTKLFGSPPADPRNALRFLYADGSIEYRTILSCTDNGLTEEIVVDSVLPAGSPIISILQRARILGDSANFKYIRPEEAIITFRFRTVQT